ncbi:MAG: gliding motility-associated C-terminal domain-containing protein [Bacteroidota bacterium]
MKHTTSCIFSFLLLVFCLEARASQNWTATFENPRSFIENKGQFSLPGNKAGKVLFAVDDQPSVIYFTSTGTAYTFVERIRKPKDKYKPKTNEGLQKKQTECNTTTRTDMIAFEWEGANPNVQVIAEQETPDYFSYSIKEGIAEKNINFIKGYKKIIYKNLYPNIDVEYIFHPQGGLKYSLILHPGADVSKVKMKYDRSVSINEKGQVIMGTLFGDIVDHAPVTFYADDQEQIIASKFALSGTTVTFELGSYNASRTVIIDPWTQNPILNNSRKIWETETDQNGNVYIYGGDSPIRLLKYNSTGTLQWTFTPSAPTWDSANYWIGGFITHPNGESYMTSGSNGEIRRINTSGTQVWYNNPNSLTTYEYWSLAFNCDLTKLVVGGTRLTFAFPTPVIRGVIMDINLTNGAIITTRVVAFGSSSSIPPSVQEVSSICMAPNNNFYFLTLDTVGSINTALTTINFKVPTSYAFDYYIPGYGFGTKQPISAIRANASAFYTLNGATIHKRDLNTGAVLATASIPGGLWTTTFFGRRVNGNGGLDIDASGNVYVGSSNQVVKYDGNLNQLATYPTAFAVYDVDVNANGEVIACGYGGGNGYVQSIAASAGAQMTYVCGNFVSTTASSTNILCNGQCTGTATANPSGGTPPYTYLWTGGQTTQTATGLCAGSYTVTVTDAGSTTATATVTITQPSAMTSSVQAQTNVLCFGQCTGSATISVSGGTPGYTYNWTPSGGNAATATGLCAGNYTCTITDANGCTRTQAVTITQPASALNSSVQSQTNVLCFGQCTGTATISATGGTPGYSYNWTPSGGNAATATGLCAGNYTCTITDANGCTRTQAVTITQPASAISASASATNTGCTSSTGTATVTASGGTGSLTYSWAPGGQTSATATGLGVGVYTVFVTDANGCTQTATATVNTTNGPTAGIASSSNPSCNGGTNGSATANASGGTSPYTYSWSNSQTGANASGLGAGTYTVYVTDANGCTSTQTITITQPAAISASASATNTGCSSSTGTATVTASGGTGTLTYSWAPGGQTSATATGLGVGTYTVLVTDANGCTQTATATVGTSNGPTAGIASSTDPLCNGGSNGSATATATGGTGPYTYSWSNGQTNANATGLAAGTYTVFVTDANGCSSTQTVTINQPAAITASTATTATNCGTNTGTATVTASGGTGTLTYSWAPGGQTGATATALASGTYTVTVTDANGCTQTATATVANANGPAVSISSSSNPLCFGNTTGTASSSVTGGTSPYTYSWSNGQTTANATGLGAGTYTVTVTDANGCTNTQTVTITQPSAITASATSANATCGSTNGSAAVTANGGTGTLSYLWNPGAQTTASISGLGAGTYTCTITDANGCSFSLTATVSMTGGPTATVSGSMTITQGQTVTLTAGGGGTYSWSNGATTSAISVSPAQTTTYCVVVADTSSCTDSACVTVYVDVVCGEFFIPTAFSPNNDGLNDFFRVKNNCITEFYLAVYDRWGEVVFETTDPSIGWDGMYKGKEMDMAVFVYRVEATLNTGETVSQKGNVTLMR